MRLFVAIDLDDDARAAIAAEQNRLKRALSGSDPSSARWIEPERMHLTLVFLGDVDEARGAAIVDAMQAGVDAAPFRMVLAGLGVFPPRGAPSVLWIGVTTGLREVTSVQRQIAERLARIGVELEKRPYHPHLTLARWRRAHSDDRRRAIAADRGTEVARVDVATVTLLQSRLSSSGSRYTTMASAELRS